MLLVSVWAKLLETCIRYKDHFLFIFMCLNTFGCFMSGFSNGNSRIFPMTVIDNFSSFSTQPAPFHLLLYFFVFICNFALSSHGGAACVFYSSSFLLYSLITDWLKSHALRGAWGLGVVDHWAQIVFRRVGSCVARLVFRAGVFFYSMAVC